MENSERCDSCGTDPGEVCTELNKLQVLIEARRVRENEGLILDQIYEIRHLLKTSPDNVIAGPWKTFCQ